MTVLKLDMPLFIRLIEWAKEDASTDVDLHKVAENLAKLKKVAKMADYDMIVDIETESDDEDEMEGTGRRRKHPKKKKHSKISFLEPADVELSSKSHSGTYKEFVREQM